MKDIGDLIKMIETVMKQNHIIDAVKSLDDLY